MKKFNEFNLGVSGDSITQGEQWSFHVYKALNMKSHHNSAVGSSVWYKRSVECGGRVLTTQEYGSPDFAGISAGWEPTEDADELQKRMNNCAVVHIRKFLAEVESGEFPAPDIFVFAYGTNDAVECVGSAEAALEGKSAEDVDLFTEAGAMRWCIQTIMEKFPECRVFVMTPIQSGNPAHNDKNRVIIENMSAVCRELSVQMIDCYGGCGICEKFETNGGEGRYLIDGLHPKANGQQLQGKFVAKEIYNNYFSV